MVNENESCVCEDCRGTGWVWSRRSDGTKEMVLCHCHPLVKSGKAKMWEGDSALRRLHKKEKDLNKPKRKRRGNREWL